MRLTTDGRRWAAALAAAAFGLVATVTALPLTAASAQESVPGGAYAGVAAADGLRVTYEVDGFLVVERFVDAGAPVAQASVSATESIGFASAPYPGDLVTAAPILLSGRFGAPVPDYPLVASTQYPTREEHAVDEGVVRLASQSTASSSTATGEAGGPDDETVTVGVTRAGAEVIHDEATGAVTSAASTTTESFVVAGVLRIGRVSSAARVVDTPDGEPQRESSLDVGEVTIAGQSVALTENGLALPGSGAPLPDGSPLLNALTDHGIAVRYLAAEETPAGVVAAGVEVRVEHPVPGAPSPAVAVYRFGRASASATGGLGTLSAGVGGGVAGFTGDTVTGAGTTSSDVAVPSAGVGSVAVPSTGSAASPAAVDSVGTAPTAAGQVEGNPLAAAQPQWAKSWTMAFYLVIVLSGVVAVSGAQMIRLLGVRMPWTS